MTQAQAVTSIFSQVEAGQPVDTYLMQITKEINAKLDVIHTESLSVGKLLIEARGEIEKYQDFIQYCRDEFSIGKAQASKLMKVATVFKEDNRFQGVAMRVLYNLACEATPEEMDRAAEFAANGDLNSTTLQHLLNPTPVKAVEPVAVPVNDDDALHSELAAALAIANIPEKQADVFQCETESPEEVESLSAEIKELRGALEAANQLIKELKDSQVVRTKASNAPLLPQFKSKCSYAVLGLTLEQSEKPSAIKKAFREIIKCGYGDGHEAFEVLTNAKNALIEALEA